MAVLLHSDLLLLIDSGVVEESAVENVGQCSIDVKFSGVFFKESKVLSNADVHLHKDHPAMDGFYDSVKLAPGEFCLASTREYFNVPPNLVMKFSLTSTMARTGLDQLQAITGNPLWSGNLTLELVNKLKYHSLILERDAICGQVEFHTTRGRVPVNSDYSKVGRYMETKGTVTGRLKK